MWKLGEYGQELLKKYAEVLRIRKEDATNILSKNKTALVFMTGESGLLMRSDERNLSILMRATIFRKFNDFETLREEEKIKIKRYYGIDVLYKISKKNFIEDCLNGDALVEDLDEYMKEFKENKLINKAQFLGMTKVEYLLWCGKKVDLEDILMCRRFGKDIETYISDNNVRMVARAKSYEEMKKAREVARKYGIS